jgi:hypothetical protein
MESATDLAKRHALHDNPHKCTCKHDRIATGGIFYNSLGVLECINCHGWQLIKQKIT